jgi:hypothetical protein
VVVVAIWLKLDCPARKRHRTTWTPPAGLAVSAPEITTLRPAVEGSGEAVMVSPPVGHVVGVQHVAETQQVPDGQQVVVQQVAGVQQLALCAQQGVVAAPFG